MIAESPVYSLPVVEALPAASSQVLLHVSTEGTDYSTKHRAPGQYAWFGFPGQERKKPMVLASAPGDAAIHLLVKSASDEEFARLLQLPGAHLEVSEPAGPGYPLDQARGRTLLLLAVGTGIAALRPVVECVLRERAAFGEVHLGYGVRRPDDRAFLVDAERWRQGLTSCTEVVSQPEGTGWQGAVGYVQDHLPPVPALAEAVVFLCGLPRMEAACTEALLAQGVPAGRIFRNYG